MEGNKIKLNYKNEDKWQHKPVPAPLDSEYQEVAWGLPKWGENFAPMVINRGKIGDYDCRLEMHYCGVCHTDVHVSLNHLGGLNYPVCAGHELLGVITEVGPKVTKVKVGDKCGVGCLADCCLDCDACKNNDE